MLSATGRQEVVMLREFGGAAGFSLVEAPMPHAGSGEVRVRVLAASVQFTDVILRKGKYPALRQEPPLVLGYDVVGEVDELGAGVSSLKLGDRVAALTVTGSYARYRTLPAQSVVRVPPLVDAAEAAALVLSWVTAYQLLHREARVIKGQKMLVQGAAGAVGQALVSLGRLAGLEVWGTARPEHAELLTALGATPLDYHQTNVRKAVPEGFDVVFDGVGEGGFNRSWAALKDGGRLCAFGLSSALQGNLSSLHAGWWLARMYLRSRLSRHKIAHFYSITALRKQHPDWYRADLETLFGMLASKVIHPQIAGRIELSGVGDAHRRIEAGGLHGKLVICPS